jgi:hypothetical protein
MPGRGRALAFSIVLIIALNPVRVWRQLADFLGEVRTILSRSPGAGGPP